jgi:hypothetical protein
MWSVMNSRDGRDGRYDLLWLEVHEGDGVSPRAVLRGLTADQLDGVRATRRADGLYDLAIPTDSGQRIISAISAEEIEDWQERRRRLLPSLLAARHT